MASDITISYKVGTDKNDSPLVKITKKAYPSDSRVVEIMNGIAGASGILPIQGSTHLEKHVIDLSISPGKITIGQGEYVVFHRLPSGEKKELTRETFEKSYKIMLHYYPSAIINSGSENTSEKCANRYNLIRKDLKEIDSTLEVTFIPRTLYELIFIKQCIEEDMHEAKYRPFHLLNLLGSGYTPMPVCPSTTDAIRIDCDDSVKTAKETKRKRWHLLPFHDAGDNENAKIRDASYRLNQVIVNAFVSLSDDLTIDEFKTHAGKEINFLKDHCLKCMKTLSLERPLPTHIYRTPGPTSHFGSDDTLQSRGFHPMGILNETHEQIILNAIVLDCSEIAKTSFLLYRGANLKKDDVLASKINKLFDGPYSLSYGSSLFAGCLYDSGATPFSYMRGTENAFAVPVPFDQLNQSIFYIPPTNTLAQLCGQGEFFHARTKAWKDFELMKLRGIKGLSKASKREHLSSNFTKIELVAHFKHYMSGAIHLKRTQPGMD